MRKSEVRYRYSAWAAAVALGFVVMLAGGRAEGPVELPEKPVVLDASELQWEMLPSGVERAVLFGDPELEGPFVLRLRYPAGYSKGPHHHPYDAFVTVLRGGYFRGYGHTFDEAAAFELRQGTFSVNPAGVSHYEWTTAPAELQIQATGPWGSTYVDEEGCDDPA